MYDINFINKMNKLYFSQLSVDRIILIVQMVNVSAHQTQNKAGSFITFKPI